MLGSAAAAVGYVRAILVGHTALVAGNAVAVGGFLARQHECGQLDRCLGASISYRQSQQGSIEQLRCCTAVLAG
jgi:hypothetical protein